MGVGKEERGGKHAALRGNEEVCRRSEKGRWIVGEEKVSWGAWGGQRAGRFVRRVTCVAWKMESESRWTRLRIVCARTEAGWRTEEEFCRRRLHLHAHGWHSRTDLSRSAGTEQGRRSHIRPFCACFRETRPLNSGLFLSQSLSLPFPHIIASRSPPGPRPLCLQPPLLQLAAI